MRRYETIFITYPELPEEEINGLIERYDAVIKGGSGTVIKVEKWGKRKLAYEINKQPRGYYVLIDFAGGTAVVTELERNLRIGDKILKYMTIKTQERVNLQDIEKEMAPPEIAEEKGEESPPSEQEKPAAYETAEATEETTVADKESESPSPEPADKEEE
ncbi:MAG: 30S ribosomal protein S6 [Syntrophales bacterium]|nr:30S ribosomal protein S6 [Syntrophales bacterium]